MKLFKVIRSLIVLNLILLGASLFSQSNEQVNWISFSQLDDSLQVKSKKVFINFYADWCTYCKEMEATTFKNVKVARLLNEEYFPVKMNIESRDTIHFGNQLFVNKRTSKINAIHEIPLLMASRKNKPFSLPAFVLMDEHFNAIARYFQFIDADHLIEILSHKK